jgi:hypothetical protein
MSLQSNQLTAVWTIFSLGLGVLGVWSSAFELSHGYSTSAAAGLIGGVIMIWVGLWIWMRQPGK